MNYTVKPLTNETKEIFTEFLGNVDFSHAPHWSTCFCRSYFTDCDQEHWMKRTGEDNRLEALKEIQAGNMRGYLAFDKDKCIGWCNADQADKFIRISQYIGLHIKDRKAGCVTCYVIHPEYRRQGVARLLLKHAIEDFKLQDFDEVIALPVDSKLPAEMHYRGTMNMYLENGFKVVESHEDVKFMILVLNKINR